CEKFYVGFDWFPIKKIGPFTIPHSLFRRQWGETVYGIGILPLGGYVKMLGQDDDPRNAEAEAERSKVLKEGTAVEGLTPGVTVEKEYVLDPRSYQAKSVPARMAIISAGVIMNLIFGVLLGTLAYAIGVPETPAVIGGTLPGSPAWEKLMPGMRAVRFSESGDTYEYHRFDDIKRKVVFTGADKEMKILFRDPDGKETLHSLKPSGRALKETDFPSLGFYGPNGRKLAADKKVPPPIEQIEDGDLVVAMNGIELERDQEKFDTRVNSILAQNPSGPLKLTLERAEKAADGAAAKDAPKKRLEVVVPQRGKKSIGVFMKIGPVVALRENSPAGKAGMQIGDVIEQIDGQPLGNPLSLSQRLIPKSSSAPPYKVVVSRKDGSKTVTKELLVAAVPPEQPIVDGFTFGGPTAIESMGVAFDVTSEIAGVELGTPAIAEGLQTGDVVKAVRFIPADKEARGKEWEKFRDNKYFDAANPLDNTTWGWTRVHYYLQTLADPKTQIELTIDRQGKEVIATMLPVRSDTFFEEDRGLNFYGIRVEHKASGAADAFSLGFREVKERLGDVATTLFKLVGGGISPKHLSGPIGIMGAAGQFANNGFPMLLLFLTMLSANLAIINFLPIPVLDGGHMLFLAAEGVRRKPVSPHIQGWLSLGGLAFLLSLMVFATAMDVQRWFQ
ncbi:MAG: site-2 protease family protein, partial [Pirellulaceae bacterium]|nr:site-2 protease family protein [Pirellulaceae bacterium]